MVRRLVNKYYIYGSHLGVSRSIRLLMRETNTFIMTKWYRSRQRRLLKYEGETDADPLKIVWVDPDELRYETATYIGTPLNKYGHVYGGSWDQCRYKIEDRTEFKSLKRHFQYGVPWEETAYYLHTKNTMKSGGDIRGFSTETEVECFFDHLDDLYTKIREQGYKSQNELQMEFEEDQQWSSVPPEKKSLNEISLNIARDGTFLWHNHGQHRLIIAKLLDVDEIPVQICTRHVEWQRIRDRIRSVPPDEANTIVSNQYRDHPDLVDLLN